jgi:hypothetical protein
MLVVTHTVDRRVQDLRSRAEVAPQHDLGMARVAFAEAEYLPRVSVPEAVDQLVVVADHAQVPARPREQVDSVAWARLVS